MLHQLCLLLLWSFNTHRDHLMFRLQTLQKSDTKLKMYTGNQLTLYGQFKAEVHYQDEEVLLLLVLAEKGDQVCWVKLAIFITPRLECNTLSVWQNSIYPASKCPDDLGTLKGLKAMFNVDNTKQFPVKLILFCSPFVADYLPYRQTSSCSIISGWWIHPRLISLFQHSQLLFDI